MKFDNVATISGEARTVELPLGTSTVTFDVIYTDIRSTSYLRMRNVVQKPYAKLIAADALPDRLDREIAARVFVRHSLKGWHGVTSDGADVPFTEDNAVAFLVASPSTFYDLLDEATDAASYKPTDEDEKNSEPASTLN